MALALRGTLLPSGEHGTVYLDGDRLTFERVAGAEVIHDGGWLLSGLVDVHTHPGATADEARYDDELLRTHLHAHAAAGVTAIRTPGIFGGVVPDWVGDDDTLPRVVPGGPWLAAPGGFFAGWAREVDLEQMPDVAVEVVLATRGWCKLVVDWAHGEGAARRYEPTIPWDTVAETVRRVHQVGGRVAVHTQHPDGAEAAALASADSLEHGMHLSEHLLGEMAAHGTALVPTMTAFQQGLDQLRRIDPPTWMSRFMLAGVDRHPHLVAAAHEAGVTMLAGTDSQPFGNVAQEAALLAGCGLPGAVAVGAASWTAREFLGFGGLDEGAVADVVAFDTDPRTSVDALAHPARVVLKGRVVR